MVALEIIPDSFLSVLKQDCDHKKKKKNTGQRPIISKKLLILLICGTPAWVKYKLSHIITQKNILESTNQEYFFGGWEIQLLACKYLYSITL